MLQSGNPCAHCLACLTGNVTDTDTFLRVALSSEFTTATLWYQAGVDSEFRGLKCFAYRVQEANKGEAGCGSIYFSPGLRRQGQE